jgi:glycosyltransferase involved in cell wall biosynthesis
MRRWGSINDMIIEEATLSRERPDTFATTVRLQSDPTYAARARVLPIPDMLPTSRYRLRDELSIFYLVLQALFREKVLLINACRGRFKPELIVTTLAGFLPRYLRPKIVLYGDFFQPSENNILGKLERFVMRLADRSTNAYVFITEAERGVFARTWRVPKEKTYVCPYFIERKRHSSPASQEVGRHIFSGGNSFRDYEPILEAARHLPDHQFVLCTSALNGRTDIPKNVHAGLVSHQEYVQLINSAAAIVIPLQTGLKRIAGLQTAFDSMWLKKPTIITDALGVREYLTDDETGLIVDGSPGSYREAIAWVMDPGNETAVATMCQKAHDTVGQYTLEKHVHHLLAVMDKIMRED